MTPIVIRSLDTGAIHLVDNDGDVATKPPDSTAKKLWSKFYSPGREEKELEKELEKGHSAPFSLFGDCICWGN